MDALRGIAVVLVILEHAVMLTPVPLDPLWQHTVDLFAPFRIPALVFLSGLLVPKSLAKSVPRYVRGKLNGIVWPYLLWSVILWSTGDAHPNPIVEILLNPSTTPLWFLGYLAVYYALMVLIPQRFVVFLLVPSLVASAFLPENGQRFFYLLAFFIAGDLVASHSQRLFALLFRREVTVISAALAVALASASFLEVHVRYQAIFAVPVFASIVAVLPLTQRFAGTTAGRAVARFGTRTVVAYILHWPAMAVSTRLMAMAGVVSGPVFVLGNFVTGVSVGLLAIILIDRVPIFGYLFSLAPSRPRPGPRARVAQAGA
jgi:peptidoglycan/LPS O-acetylase OafA/YrhL